LSFRYYRLSPQEKNAIAKRLEDELSKTGEVLFAYVHGGFLRRGEFRDIDVAVWLKEGVDPLGYEVDLPARLEAELRLPVDIHVLNSSPLPFRYQVVTSGKLLFSRNESLRSRIVDATVRAYIDFKELVKTTTNVRPSRGAAQKTTRSL
jgi:predicted nucleotidyltransferase